MSNDTRTLCDEVNEELARILDGTAAPELHDHIADCDACRDLRHEASRVVPWVAGAGGDFQAIAGLDVRLLAALDARAGAPEGGGDSSAQQPVGEDELPAAVAGAAPAANTAALEAKDDAPGAEASGPSAGAEAPRAPTPGVSAGVVRLSPRRVMAGGIIAAVLATAAGGALLLGRTRAPGGAGETATAAPWAGQVASIARAGKQQTGGLERCDAAGAACAPLAMGDRVEPGSLVRTDGHTRVELRLGDGSDLVLDRSSELVLRKDEDRSARLLHGAVTADVSHIDGANARVAVPVGVVEVLGTKFTVHADDDRARVEVARGTVMLRDAQGHSEKVRSGEEGRIATGKQIAVFPSPTLAEGFAWSDRVRRGKESARDEAGPEPLRGLGELKARKPGQQDERDGAVKLTKHDVKVRIAGNVARTEIDESFQNETAEELEGIFRFPLPPDAQIERLALEVNGKLEEGAFVDKDKAAAIWRGVIKNAAPTAPRPVEEIFWVPGPWRDPALLEWKRGGRFELRIFPIPAKGSRRVVLAYTQTVQPVGGVRRYTYPLPYDAKGSTVVDSFHIDAQVVGHDKAQGVRASGYTLASAQPAGAGAGAANGGGDVDRLEMSERHFQPAGDLVLEYALPPGSGELDAWAYQPEAAGGSAVDDGSAYVAFALRPRLPRAKDDASHEQVIVVDRSRSMVGERFARARAVVTAMVREMDERDRVKVMACDTTCQSWPEGLVEAGASAAEAAERFLGATQPDGASDVVEMVRLARDGARSERRGGKPLQIVYVGDGGVSAGPSKPDHVTAAVRALIPDGDGSVTAVAVGADADATLLSALARGGGGVVVPFVPGERAGEAALSALAASYGTALRSPELVLPAGFIAVAPTQLDTMRAGSETVVVARMTSPQIEGEAVLRGKVGQEAFEQRYPIKILASRGAGNAFVPRLYAASRIAELERAGGDGAKQGIVELSKRFSVASRYTSLLVLESEAMLNAFGLKRSQATPRWTGEQAALGSTTRGTVEVPDADEASEGKKDKSAREESAAGEDDRFSAGAGRAAAPANMGPAATAAAPPAAKASPMGRRMAPMDEFNDMPMPRQRMVPMRKVWDRKGAFAADVTAFHDRDGSKIIAAEGASAAKPDSQKATHDLFALYAQHGRLDRAAELADRWASRDALDPAALAARADVAARNGNRDLAIRILGGVVDVRPDDAAAQNRLAQLLELSGLRQRGCAHRVTLAELAPSDTKAQAAAVRCSRETGATELADRLLADVPSDKRTAVDRALDKAPSDPSALRGDVQLEATWDADVDLDLALIDKKGQRLGWMGAGKAAVTARDVSKPRSEAVAFQSLGSGTYVVELTRAGADAGPGAAAGLARDSRPVSGTLTIRVVGETRKVPFTITGNRVEVGRVEVSYQSRLVPAW
jgi:tetratricopeptide (TPR) repeat protein